VLLAVGAVATHHGVRAFRAADAGATWHVIDSPSSTDLRFKAGYTDRISIGSWLIAGVLSSRRIAQPLIAHSVTNAR
jgi:hypothetical protein